MRPRSIQFRMVKVETCGPRQDKDHEQHGKLKLFAQGHGWHPSERRISDLLEVELRFLLSLERHSGPEGEKEGLHVGGWFAPELPTIRSLGLSGAMAMHVRGAIVGGVRSFRMR